jgi:hypothetical protein
MSKSNPKKISKDELNQFLTGINTETHDVKITQLEIKDIFSSLLSSSVQHKVREQIDPVTQKPLLYFRNKDDNTEINMEKSYLDTTISKITAQLFEKLKNDITTNPSDKTARDIIYVVEAFSGEIYKDTVPQKQCFNMLKSILSQVKNNYNFNNNPKASEGIYLLNKRIAYYASHETKYTPDNYNQAILTFYQYGLVQTETLENAEFFSRFNFDELFELCKKGIIPQDEFLNIVDKDTFKDKYLETQERLLYWEAQKDSSSAFYDQGMSKKEIDTNTRKIEKELSFLTSIPGVHPLIIDLYLDGELEEKVFDKIFDRIRLKDLNNDQLIDLLSSNYGNKIKISSDELLKMYGTKLSGSDLITLAYMDKVDHKKLIDLPNLKNSNAIAPYFEVNPKQLIDFYQTGRTLFNLYQEGKLDNEFASKLSTLMKENLDPIELEIAQAQIVSRTQFAAQTDNVNPEPILMDFYKMGIVSPERLKGFVSSSTIENMYYDEKLNMQEILQLVSSDVIQMKDTNKFFTSDEILENILNGTISQDYLKAFDSETIAKKLQELYIDDKCPLNLFMKAYLEYDIIPTDRLNDTFELKEPEDDLTQFITKESNIERVRDLFTNYHISYEDLSSLLRSNIIDKETFDNLKMSIDKTKFYDRLRKEKEISVQTSEVTSRPYVPTDKPTNPKRESNIDFDLEKMAFEDLFGTPKFGKGNMPVLKSINTITGKKTTLDGYIIIPIEKYGLVAMDKFQAENIFFIMPYQQADYFLHGNMDILEQDGTVNVPNRNKRTLASMESVKYRKHTKNFWKDVILFACELSDEARQDFKPNGKNAPLVDDYIKAMKERYDEKLKKSKALKAQKALEKASSEDAR